LEIPEGQFVSGLYVTALVHAAYGAYPTACRGRYAYDAVQIRRRAEAAQTPEACRVYLDACVFANGAVARPAGV
jgi:glutaconate CoA-transferase, subunit A